MLDYIGIAMAALLSIGMLIGIAVARLAYKKAKNNPSKVKKVSLRPWAVDIEFHEGD